MNKYIKIILSILASLFGLFLIVFGEHDDSPGAQGLGFILIIIAAIFAIKRAKQSLRQRKGSF